MEIVNAKPAVEPSSVGEASFRVVNREEYLRMEGFVHERQPDGRDDGPLFRYLLVNFVLLAAGLAAWAGVVAGVMWMLS
jgi:hypothetical protein